MHENAFFHLGVQPPSVYIQLGCLHSMSTQGSGYARNLVANEFCNCMFVPDKGRNSGHIHVLLDELWCIVLTSGHYHVHVCIHSLWDTQP